MSDETNTPEEDVSELRKAAKDGASAKREAELLKRELAFTRAGIDTESKPAKALLNAYDGELTAEAIKAEATEWGLLTATPEPEPEPDNSAAVQAQATREAMQGTPAPDTKPAKSGVEGALDQFLEDREAGYSQTEATNRAFGAVIKAAAQGDRSAVFNPHDWEEKARAAGHGAEYAR